MRILIVDDDPDILHLLRDECVARGFSTIFESTDGAQALSVLKNKTVDVVLTDLRMPNMDGIDLVRKVRDLYPDLPIFMFTGFAVEAEEVMGEGAHGVFSKPDGFDNVVSAVIEMAKKRKAVRP